MSAAEGDGVMITPRFLRRSAAAMRRCAGELVALGRPPRLLRQTYQRARRACAAFAQVAKINVAVARIMSTAGGSDPRLNNLFNQSDTALNRGDDLMSQATNEAPSLPGN